MRQLMDPTTTVPGISKIWWMHEEEWYPREESPRSSGFTVLARVNEDSYSPVVKLMTIDQTGI
jgi:hypothetical protein